MTTDYNKQATEFLKSTNTTLTVSKAIPQKLPLHWGKDNKDIEKHIHYTFTLSNPNHTYTGDYWGSIRDYNLLQYATEYGKENGEVYRFLKEKKVTVKNPYFKKNVIETVEKLITPTSYDILACLSPVYADTFEDFCNEYGYGSDSITAKETYHNCLEQDRNLRKLFDHNQLNQLSEIQ